MADLYSALTNLPESNPIIFLIITLYDGYIHKVYLLYGSPLPNIGMWKEYSIVLTEINFYKSLTKLHIIQISHGISDYGQN